MTLLAAPPLAAHQGGLDPASVSICAGRERGDACRFEDHHQQRYDGECHYLPGHVLACVPMRRLADVALEAGAAPVPPAGSSRSHGLGVGGVMGGTVLVLGVIAMVSRRRATGVGRPA